MARAQETITIDFTPRTIEQILDFIGLGHELVRATPDALGQLDVLTSALAHIYTITAIHRPESERLPIALVHAIAAYVYGNQGGHRFDRTEA